jgi:tRNA-(ms[2]io[6]A)-hydroxylase
VLRVLAKRGGAPSPTHRNAYASDLRRLVRMGAGREELLDHLLVSALIEARSCERFEVLAEVAREADAELAALFRGLTASERGHHRLFLELAADVAGADAAHARWAALLVEEARVLAAQRPGARIHAGEPLT